MRQRRTLVRELVGALMPITATCLLAAMPAVAASAMREDPVVTGSIVKLEVQGGPTAFFSEVSGLGSESEVIEQRGGSGGQPVASLPGRLKWKEIVLKRGLTGDRSLSAWRGQVEAGSLKGSILNFVITLLGPSMQPVARWEGSGGWPSRLIIFPLADRPTLGSTPPPLVEEVTIVHSGLVRTQ